MPLSFLDAMSTLDARQSFRRVKRHPAAGPDSPVTSGVIPGPMDPADPLGAQVPEGDTGSLMGLAESLMPAAGRAPEALEAPDLALLRLLLLKHVSQKSLGLGGLVEGTSEMFNAPATEGEPPFAPFGLVSPSLVRHTDGEPIFPT